MKKIVSLWMAAVCLIGACCLATEASGSASPAAAQFAALAAKAEADQRVAIAGKDGWLFLTAELRHLGVAFLGRAAAAVSRSARKGRLPGFQALKQAASADPRPFRRPLSSR
jgi:hypothetical protein